MQPQSTFSRYNAGFTQIGSFNTSRQHVGNYGTWVLGRENYREPPSNSNNNSIRPNNAKYLLFYTADYL